MCCKIHYLDRVVARDLLLVTLIVRSSAFFAISFMTISASTGGINKSSPGVKTGAVIYKTPYILPFETNKVAVRDVARQ